jgi:glutamate synthase (NADPH/NADH) large chain
MPPTSQADRHARSRTLYDPSFEHDACGVGFVARLSGKPAREILDLGLEALRRLAHRGAVAADGKSGDGAGVLTQIPTTLFLDEADGLGCRLAEADQLAVGMVFLPSGDTSSVPALSAALEKHGFRVLGWRDVPVDPLALGRRARDTQPTVRQVLAVPRADVEPEERERQLYLARKQFEREVQPGYICSLSSRTVVYKALCAAHQLPAFYPDLADPRFETALVVYHQRFSTNTLPTWQLAQPFRLLAHNGEINTLWGNRAWMRAREADLPREIQPALQADGSDSANIDETLELLARNGRSLAHSLSMIVVPAWEEAQDLDPKLRAFYRYHAPFMEPWDGPAALTFSDGGTVGAALDRNGLRPCRYKVTRDGLVVAGSEVGVLDLDPDEVVEKGRLGPGQMLLVDLERNRLYHDAEIKRELADAKPYDQWSQIRQLAHEVIRDEPAETHDDEALTLRQRIYGLTREDLKLILGPMAEQGRGPSYSMGDDTPIPPLAQRPRSIYAFLRQRFAQVTNPAIDPIREKTVMSLRTWVGPRPLLHEEGPLAPVVELPSPILTVPQLDELGRVAELPVARLACVFFPDRGQLRPALDELCHMAEVAVREGARLLVLSDRDITEALAPIPMALAVGAIHHHLLWAGRRARTGLIVDAGDCWDDHHVAVLIGYGASAVCPRLALCTARRLGSSSGEASLVQALEFGLRKIMSKMGISTVTSYRGGQHFDALGLADEVMDRCFVGTPSRIGGFTFAQLADHIIERHQEALGSPEGSKLADFGRIRYRRDGEYHRWQPPAVRALHRAVGTGRHAGAQPDASAWEEFAELAGRGSPAKLRDLLDVTSDRPALAADQVELPQSIARRFVSSAMSLGALSPEAHRTLTIAMNRLGGRSNTGEGGEDVECYEPLANGDRAEAKIKQIASGRFGVTTQYIARAEELEIKISQGSKPGEGGQLPAHKVTALIARLRHTQPGVSLISPPPHHDIYSIEDLAQLIYDLKRCNPEATVGVKLVSEAGVGTVAAGVAKAYADFVVISGSSGGTGASPLSSIKYAGSPWELGLAETQQVLVRNGLRSRVRLRVDGGFMTGRDVLIAALLGAEEFSFGTAPLVAMGCDMARQCHLDTCPTGIATQRADLRKRFRGSPEQVVRYFLRVGEEVQHLLAELGLSSLDEAVGRVDLLQQVEHTAGLDLAPLLAQVPGDASRCLSPRNDRPEEEEPFEEALLGRVISAIESGDVFSEVKTIRNSDRSVGARLAGALALHPRYGTLPAGSVTLHCSGAAGQSFGAYLVAGQRLILVGEANDYVGKGLCGGEIILRPTGFARPAPHRHVILGNVALYGATSGRLFAAGRSGERFAVRNSGAVAVVEGSGDHCCEYMTGGCVVVLGETGINFGAGMSGGSAYVLDEEGIFPRNANPELLRWTRPDSSQLEEVRQLVEAHYHSTESARGRMLLDHWNGFGPQFWLVQPKERDQNVESTEQRIERAEPNEIVRRT